MARRCDETPQIVGVELATSTSSLVSVLPMLKLGRVYNEFTSTMAPYSQRKKEMHARNVGVTKEGSDGDNAVHVRKLSV